VHGEMTNGDFINDVVIHHVISPWVSQSASSLMVMLTVVTVTIKVTVMLPEIIFML